MDIRVHIIGLPTIIRCDEEVRRKIEQTLTEIALDGLGTCVDTEVEFSTERSTSLDSVLINFSSAAFLVKHSWVKNVIIPVLREAYAAKKVPEPAFWELPTIH